MIECIIKTETDSLSGKIGIAEICRNIMPEGVPKYLEVVRYPTIKSLLAEKGMSFMHKVVFLMVKDFCQSLNVVRNMNETQMIDTATMLIDECGNFRLEDYVMMFQMGKRGELIKIRDRVDIEVITEMLDEYWRRRNIAGEEQWLQQNKHLETLGNQTRVLDTVHIGEQKIMNALDGMQAGFSALKKTLEEKVGNREEREKLKQIEQADIEAIKQRKKDLGYE